MWKHSKSFLPNWIAYRTKSNKTVFHYDVGFLIIFPLRALMYFRTFKSQHISFSLRKDLFSHKVHSFTSAVLILQYMSLLPSVRTKLQWALNNKSNLPPSCIVKFIPQIFSLSDSLPVNSFVDSARIDQGFPDHFDKFSLDRYPMEVVMANGLTVRHLICSTYQWRIQDFPQGGRQLPKVLLFFNFLPKTAWKWKNLDPRGGGRAPPLGSANAYLTTESRRNPSNWAEYFFVSYTSPSFY